MYRILLTMYETAVRVSELINIKDIDFRFSKPYSISVTGKGNKQRYIPLSEKYIQSDKKYIESPMNSKRIETDFLFYNRSGQKLMQIAISFGR